MKLSKIVAGIAAGNTYDEKALLKCLSIKLILRDELIQLEKRF